MKIAIVHNHPIHYKHLLFSEMRKRGLAFRVLFLAAQSDVRHERIPLSQDLYEYEIGYEGAYEEAPSWHKARFIWKSLQEMRPPIVIVSGYHAAECWAALIWARLHDKPVILWFESNLFDYSRRWYKEIFKTIFLRNCAAAHVYGITNKEYLTKLGMDPDLIYIKRAVVHVGLFASAPREAVESDGVCRLLYVGRLAPEKNVGMLLNAFARCLTEGENRKGFLTIVGTGPCEGELRQQCADLNVSDLVEFRGYVPQKDLHSVFRANDVFVLPSIREPYGLVALEAMLGRMPIIVSTQCGCAKDLVSPETGWTFNPFDTEDLVRVMKAAMAVPFLERREMGDAAFRCAVDYSPENSATIVVESIERAMVAATGSTVFRVPNEKPGNP
jgi:glycosyltransferase involved in cell wall biosynthesis